MTKLITQAVFDGTKQNYSISGLNADQIMRKARRMRELRGASVFIFFSRKTGKMIDVRMN